MLVPFSLEGVLGQQVSQAGHVELFALPRIVFFSTFRLVEMAGFVANEVVEEGRPNKLVGQELSPPSRLISKINEFCQVTGVINCGTFRTFSLNLTVENVVYNVFYEGRSHSVSLEGTHEAKKLAFALEGESLVLHEIPHSLLERLVTFPQEYLAPEFLLPEFHVRVVVPMEDFIVRKLMRKVEFDGDGRRTSKQVSSRAVGSVECHNVECAVFCWYQT